jgi:hypothetical protein
MLKKVLYIGAGLHMTPLTQIDDVDEFVFVDTLPRSEFDRWSRGFRECYYRDSFVDDLIGKCRELGFHPVDGEELDRGYFKRIMNWYQRWIWLNKVKQTFPFICPTLITFHNKETNQVLKYYVSTNMRTNMCARLNDDLQSCDGIIISGHHPDIKLLDHVSLPLKTLYGYSSTVFICREEEDEKTIIEWFDKNPNAIQEYYLCDYQNMMNEIKCNNIQDLNKKSLELRSLQQV